MSGHSKWSTIKRDKGAKDAKKGVLFSKLSKKISLAVKDGGSGDPTHNLKLRTEIEAAKAHGFTNDNIDRAIKKGLGQDGGGTIEEVVYEGYGPFSTAFIIEAVTDNTNRTVGNIKKLLTKAGGSLGALGSVSWQFQTRGEILVERGDSDLEALELTAIDAGATDVIESDEGLAIYTEPTQLTKVQKAIEAIGVKIVHGEIIKESSQGVELTEQQKPIIEELFSNLENDEDVISVHTNANF
jgi:YebC/PmpR family DNA-binding regulatory protein